MIRQLISWYTNQRGMSCVYFHDLLVTSYFYCTSYELLFMCKLRRVINCTSYELLFICKLRRVINSTIRVTIWVTSHSKDKDDEAVYDNKVMIKNYSLGGMIFW